MFRLERSVLLPHSRPRNGDGSADSTAAVPGLATRTPPVPATFLEPAAGGAFELFPRRQFHGPGDLAQATLRAAAPDPLRAGLARPAAPFRATAPLPPLPALPIPAAPRLRRRA